MSDRPVTVIVVEGHEATRCGVREILGRNHRIAVVGEAASAAEALPLLAVLRPDVVLLDEVRRDGRGLDVCRALRALGLPTRAVAFADQNDPQQMSVLEGRSVYGYVRRSGGASELQHTVLDAARHGSALHDDPGAPATLESAPGQRRGPSDLTTREREVAEYLTEGCTNQEIADSMHISKRTVETHVRHVLLKLGVRSRAKAVMWLTNDGRSGTVSRRTEDVKISQQDR